MLPAHFYCSVQDKTELEKKVQTFEASSSAAESSLGVQKEQLELRVKELVIFLLGALYFVLTSHHTPFVGDFFVVYINFVAIFEAIRQDVLLFPRG